MKHILLVILLILSMELYSSEFWGKDKAAHFSGSFMLTVWSSGYGGEVCGIKGNSRIYLGFGIALGAGLGKEASDLLIKQSKWNWYDLFWDAAGIGAAVVMINNDLIL